MKNKQAKDIMHYPVIKAGSNYSISKCINIMKNQNIGFLPIVENDILVGVVTDRDILMRSTNKHYSNCSISKIMTSYNLIFVDKNTPLNICESLMIENNIHRLPVLTDGNVEGIITSKDLLKENHKIKASENKIINFYKTRIDSDNIKIDDYRL